MQVSCSIQIGASTGGVDKSNFLCILGNNLFNQKYFLILWVWWVFLLVMAVLGLIYRVTRILVPDFSRYLLVFIKYDQESFIFCVRERCVVKLNISSIYPSYVLKSSIKQFSLLLLSNLFLPLAKSFVITLLKPGGY